MWNENKFISNTLEECFRKKKPSCIVVYSLLIITFTNSEINEKKTPVRTINLKEKYKQYKLSKIKYAYINLLKIYSIDRLAVFFRMLNELSAIILTNITSHHLPENCFWSAFNKFLYLKKLHFVRMLAKEITPFKD